ncbi:SPON1 [Symbiodinium sp. CCMP2592]|nr:SPON1 [Symbiodinium sp. CCMP2592]
MWQRSAVILVAFCLVWRGAGTHAPREMEAKVSVLVDSIGLNQQISPATASLIRSEEKLVGIQPHIVLAQEGQVAHQDPVAAASTVPATTAVTTGVATTALATTVAATTAAATVADATSKASTTSTVTDASLQMSGSRTPTTMTVVVTHIEVHTATIVFTEQPSTTTSTTTTSTTNTTTTSTVTKSLAATLAPILPLILIVVQSFLLRL